MKSLQSSRIRLGPNLWAAPPGGSTTKHPLGRLILDTLALWAQRRRTRNRLVDLEDRLLEDIGITRHEADAEHRKWFWQE